MNKYLFGLLIGWMMAFTGEAATHRAISIDNTSKAVRKEIKVLKKDGWKPAPGWPSIDEQVIRHYQMRAELDSDMSEVYLFSSLECAEWDYNDAKRNAKELAMQELAGMIQTRVIMQDDVWLESNKIDSKDVQIKSIMKQVSKQIVMQRLRDLIPVMELFRKQPDGQFEVHVCWACKKKQAEVIAEEVIDNVKNMLNQSNK